MADSLTSPGSTKSFPLIRAMACEARMRASEPEAGAEHQIFLVTCRLDQLHDILQDRPLHIDIAYRLLHLSKLGLRQD